MLDISRFKVYHDQTKDGMKTRKHCKIDFVLHCRGTV